jgi:hypothetical protein
MGTVLRFPTERVRGALVPSYLPEPAEILILPVIRVERGTWDGESGGTADPEFSAPERDDSLSGGKRRRRAPRP